MKHIAMNENNSVLRRNHDLTGRIGSDDKLASSRKLFRALVENSNDIIILMDYSFNHIYRSPAAARITGWTDEDMLGVNTTKNIHIEDQPYINSIIKEAMASPGKTIETKLRMKHKDGRYLWLEGTLTNLLQDKHIQAVVLNFRDISTRVEAEEKLKASEKQFRYTLDNMLEGAQILDFDWRFIYVNDALVKSSKSSKEDLIGNTLMEIYPGIEQTGLFKTLHRCMTERATEHLETPIFFPDGKKADYELSIQPVPEGIFILSIDITERIKQAKKLLQNQKRFNQAQEIVHIGNWEVNFKSNTSRWSDEAYKIYGLTPGSHGLSVDEWMSFVHPDDIDSVKKEIENSQVTLKDFSLNHRIVRKDGVVRHVYSQSKYEFNAEGTPVGLYGIVHDVTETKKAEEDLRRSETSLNEAQAIAHISNWEIDLTENIHKWSDEFYRIYGLNKQEVQPSAELFLSLMHPDDMGFAREKIAEAFMTSNDSSFHFRFIRSDNVTRYGYSEWKFEFDKKGIPTRLFGIVQDITERKEAEENLISLQKEMLAQKIQEQRKIARTIIKTQEKERNHIGQELHDNITQMLAGTKLFLEIAANKNESVKTLTRYPVELIDKTIEEIRLLCRQLVTPVKNVDLKDLIRTLIKILEQTAIKTEFIYSVPTGILSDDLQLNIYRIIQELVNNVIKYAGANNVNITVKTNQKYIDIIVTDDGKGFDQERKRNGIGISNMTNRVMSFNGEIKIESSEGNGCRTSITIPY
ncbi:MAG: PAS domain S-box protein [Bacteroidota bacterium]